MDKLIDIPQSVQLAVRSMIHRATQMRQGARSIHNIELWASSLLDYDAAGHHKIATMPLQVPSQLENQVGDLLPSLLPNQRACLADRLRTSLCVTLKGAIGTLMFTHGHSWSRVHVAERSRRSLVS